MLLNDRRGRRSDALHAARRFDALSHARGMLEVYRDMLPGRFSTPELESELQLVSAR